MNEETAQVLPVVFFWLIISKAKVVHAMDTLTDKCVKRTYTYNNDVACGPQRVEKSHEKAHHNQLPVAHFNTSCNMFVRYVVFFFLIS